MRNQGGHFGVIRTVALFIICVIPIPLHACSACAYASADYSYPAYWWGGAFLIWYLALSSASKIYGIPLGRLTLGRTFANTAVILALFWLAPQAIFLFAIMATISWFRTLFVSYRSLPPGQQNALAVMRLTPVLVMIVLIASSSYHERQRAHMRTADWFNRWPGTELTRRLTQQLNAQGAAALPEWRDIVARSSTHDTVRAAKALAKWGTPAHDVPLLISLLGRLETKEYNEWFIPDVGASLVSMTGFDLGTTAPANQWEQRWAAATATSSTLRLVKPI
jgi:hypothetical protein